MDQRAGPARVVPLVRGVARGSPAGSGPGRGIELDQLRSRVEVALICASACFAVAVRAPKQALRTRFALRSAAHIWACAKCLRGRI